MQLQWHGQSREGRVERWLLQRNMMQRSSAQHRDKSGEYLIGLYQGPAAEVKST